MINRILMKLLNILTFQNFSIARLPPSDRWLDFHTLSIAYSLSPSEDTSVDGCEHSQIWLSYSRAVWISCRVCWPRDRKWPMSQMSHPAHRADTNGLFKYLNIKNFFFGRLTLYLLPCEVFIIKANSQSRAIEIVRFNMLTVNGIADCFALPYKKKRFH